MNPRAAALMGSTTFFMLPLASSANTIETGVVASWNASSFCGTPSSTTSSSSIDMSASSGLESVIVNSMVGRTGGGFGAK